MKPKHWARKLSIVRQYQYKWVVGIALLWTVIDFFRFFVFSIIEKSNEYPFIHISVSLVVLRFVFVFIASMWMAYLIMIKFKKSFRFMPLWLGILLKTMILYAITLLFYFFLFVSIYYLLYHFNFIQTIDYFLYYFSHNYYLFNNSGVWLLVFIITQLVIEINEKYSPGMFMDIFLGKYIIPVEKEKIIMFIDLVDSTSIAEQLGHKQFFLFIKDFIYYTSIAILKCEGNIYQYVGDEVVVSWPLSEKNCNYCIKALTEAKRELQREKGHFQRKYSLTPDFRAGIHIGKVMVGEIGVIKKDLAMSGDPMNTTARIKDISSTLNKKYLVSKDFIDVLNVKTIQVESIGVVELKGKEDALELFSLGI